MEFTLHPLNHEECVKTFQKGLLASGSLYALRLPVCIKTVAEAGVVPGHSGGSATDSHRLPLLLKSVTD